MSDHNPPNSLDDSDSEQHNVIGSDGWQPVYRPKDLWKTWSVHEIYTGQAGKNRYVPKVLDHVVEPTTNQRWYVKTLDQLTLIPELVALGNSNNMSLSSQDLLFAVAPGWPSQAYRIYCDDTVFPYRMDVDGYLSIRAVQAAYAKVIHGSIYGEHEVVSKIYDAGGNFVTDRVPLQLVALEAGWTNYHIKTTETFYTNKKWQNGDVLSVVVYSQGGHVLGITPLSVINSNHLRDLNAPTKYITHISMDSPFVSETDPTRLELPLNWNKSSMNVMGVVHYSDGRSVKLPIDGNKFEMNISRLLSSIPGHEFDTTLRYLMDPTEAASPEVSAFNNGINQPIRVVITEANNSYTVKLYPVLRWNPNTSVYRLEWYLVNLDRQWVRDVTTYVQFAANQPVFNGGLYGAVQRVQVSLNLRSVMGTFKPYIHTQIVDITLYGSPVDYPTPFVYKASHMDSNTYGAHLWADRLGQKSLSIQATRPDQEAWLDELYGNLEPIAEIFEDESLRVRPTHVRVKYKTQEVDVPISEWNQPINFLDDIELHETVTLTWLRETSSGYLFLGIGCLIIQDVIV